MPDKERCKVEGCQRPYRAKGYCNVHYKKWRQGELPHRRYKTCHGEGCRKPIAVRGLCEEHAGIKKQEAAPTVPAAPAPTAETTPAEPAAS